ncbi:MAG TPA: hypothetical protein VN672_04455 [Solirubrobacteraceae bacterium]|nr:hypothetical protein [Solirubrobacteraceae bacterium]
MSLSRARHTRARGLPAPEQSSPEIQRLWRLAAIEQAVRSQQLQFDPLTGAGESLGPGLEELFETGKRSLHKSLAEAVADASAEVARRYRHAGRAARGERIRERVRAILDSHNEAAEGSLARRTLLPPPTPDVTLSVWELPRAQRARPSRHLLEGRQVLVVLEGRVALRANAGARNVHRDQAVVVPPSGGELLNDSAKPVRFLALRSVIR